MSAIHSVAAAARLAGWLKIAPFAGGFLFNIRFRPAGSLNFIVVADPGGSLLILLFIGDQKINYLEAMQIK